jgi:hypothetical protein
MQLTQDELKLLDETQLLELMATTFKSLRTHLTPENKKKQLNNLTNIINQLQLIHPL